MRSFVTRGLGLLLVAALAGCASGVGPTRVVEGAVSFELPPGWHATAFSETVSPGRLVAASFDVRQEDVEGDCGGYRAVERLPRDGAYVVVIDYGVVGTHEPAFARRLPVDLDDGRLANFECFGESRMVRVGVEGRALQVHVGLGVNAGEARRAEALHVVNSLRAAE
jgi:hypothetical protein